MAGSYKRRRRSSLSSRSRRRQGQKFAAARRAGRSGPARACAAADHFRGAHGRLVAAKPCLYATTPDGDFVVDRLPGAPNIIVASPCSGHGFKFAPVIGKILADLATIGATTHDIARFSLGRLG